MTHVLPFCGSLAINSFVLFEQVHNVLCNIHIKRYKLGNRQSCNLTSHIIVLRVTERTICSNKIQIVIGRSSNLGLGKYFGGYWARIGREATANYHYCRGGLDSAQHTLEFPHRGCNLDLEVLDLEF